MSAQGLQFRAEKKQIAEGGPIKRLDAQTVANQRQGAFLAVPKREGEHADQPFDGPGHAEGRAGFEDHLGIGMAAKANAACGQLRADFLVAVNLAVIDDDETAAGRNHRLMAGGREIDDREPALP